MGNTEITHNDSNKPIVELGIEFVVEVLLFLYPYGAEQMNLPHNFWLGLGCWIVGSAIAIRMFWIFPILKDRLSILEKGLITFILVVTFVLLFYKPVEAAYKKRDGVATTQTTQNPQPLIPSTTPVSVTRGAENL